MRRVVHCTYVDRLAREAGDWNPAESSQYFPVDLLLTDEEGSGVVDGFFHYTR